MLTIMSQIENLACRQLFFLYFTYTEAEGDKCMQNINQQVWFQRQVVLNKLLVICNSEITLVDRLASFFKYRSLCFNHLPS